MNENLLALIFVGMGMGFLAFLFGFGAWLDHLDWKKKRPAQLDDELEHWDKMCRVHEQRIEVFLKQTRATFEAREKREVPPSLEIPAKPFNPADYIVTHY